MPQEPIDFDPVTHLTIDAIGKPGKRTFFIQGWRDQQTLTILIEKAQAQTLAIGIEQFLAEIGERFPEIPESSDDYDEAHMHINPPVDPLFRAGEVGLGYDADRDLAVLIIREVLIENMDPEDVRTVRFWCTRSQIRALGRWGLEVSGRGRPICPYCGQPMDPEGHFCPKRNGHKH